MMTTKKKVRARTRAQLYVLIDSVYFLTVRRVRVGRKSVRLVTDRQSFEDSLPWRKRRWRIVRGRRKVWWEDKDGFDPFGAIAAGVYSVLQVPVGSKMFVGAGRFDEIRTDGPRGAEVSVRFRGELRQLE